jgi:hypothetical protein
MMFFEKFRHPALQPGTGNLPTVLEFITHQLGEFIGLCKGKIGIYQGLDQNPAKKGRPVACRFLDDN